MVSIVPYLLLVGAVVNQGILVLAQEEARFSREKVRQMLSSGNIQSVENVLEYLEETGHDDFFHHYVLMFHSRSSQEASFEHPRAIMVSPRSEFVMAINGSEEQEGGQRIEMMEYDREERAFRFFELDLQPSPPQLSEVNPQRCLNCHREDPRPNWDHYFFWAGMYGGDDDFLTRYMDIFYKKNGESLASSNFFRTKRGKILASREARKYTEFYVSKGQHSRYSYLKDFITYSERSKERGYYRRPGLDLTNFLHSLNGKRIERKLEETIGVAPPHFKYALLGTAYCIYPGIHYSSPNRFIPKTYLNERKVEPFDDYLIRHASQVKRDILRRIHIHGSVTGDDVSSMGRIGSDDWQNYLTREAPYSRLCCDTSNYHFLIDPTLAPIKYVMALVGVDNSDWSLSFSGMPVSQHSASIVSRDFVVSSLWEEDDHTFKMGVGDSTSVFSDPEICHHLMGKSMEAFESAEAGD